MRKQLGCWLGPEALRGGRVVQLIPICVRGTEYKSVSQLVCWLSLPPRSGVQAAHSCQQSGLVAPADARLRRPAAPS